MSDAGLQHSRAEYGKSLVQRLLEHKSFMAIADLLKEKGILRPTLRFVDGEALMIYEDIAELEDGVELLKLLLDEGLVEPHPIDYMVQCPECGGICIETKYRCPHCGSTMIEKVRIIQHLLCGHTNTETHFIRRKTDKGVVLVCPVCNNVLERLGEDYRVLGIVYECQNCRRRIASPQLIHLCRSCGRVFDVRDAAYRPIYGLKLTSRGLRFLEMDLVASMVQAVLEDLGFKVKRNVEVMGASGIRHLVDIYAERGDGTTVAIDVLRSGDEASALRAMVKKLDLDPAVRYFLVAGWMSSDIINVLASSNIPVIPSNELNRLKEVLGEEEGTERLRRR